MNQILNFQLNANALSNSWDREIKIESCKELYQNVHEISQIKIFSVTELLFKKLETAELWKECYKTRPNYHSKKQGNKLYSPVD